MKRTLYYFIVLIVFFFSPTAILRAEFIESWESTYTIATDGSFTVKENILYDFEDAERHGIFRMLPYERKNSDGKLFRMNFSDFLVFNEVEKPYQFTKSDSNGEVTLKIGDPNKTITGKQRYIITYQVSGGITYFSDHDELYWNITGNGWDVPIRNVSVSLSLPTHDSTDDTAVCYTGSVGSTVNFCTVSRDDTTTIVRTTASLGGSEGLTVVVGFPKGIVTVLEPKEVNTWLSDLFIQLIAIVMGIVAFIWYLGLPVWIIFTWWKNGRDPKATVGAAHVWFSVPETKNKIALTAAETGTLVDETVDMKDIVATIIDLARRGYIRIDEKKKNDFYLEKLEPKKIKEPLRDFEESLYGGIFSSGKTSVHLKDAELSSEIALVKTKLYERVVSLKLFPKNPNTVRTLYMILAGFAFFTGNIFLAIIAYLFGRAMPKKTLDGVNAANVAKALKGFIVSQDKQYAFQAKKQLFFEKFLPFAIVFGVEKIWANRFRTLGVTRPSWYTTYDNSAFTTVLFTNTLMHSFNSTITSAATPTRSSSGFSSGFSGGSSGGGGGGGGGGSW